jgi:hypothetical protein
MIVTLTDGAGAELARHELTARTSGTVSLDIPLAATVTPGSYALTVASDETIYPATRYIEVFQRTTERIMATIALDQDLVIPGGHLTGAVRVLSPSGSPVRGATVELYPSSDYPTPIVVTTGADGRAPFEATAPTYLSGDVATVTAYARIVHPALGTITAYAGYTMARTAFLVSATPEAGGLVPEVDTRLYLSVADPRGTPIRAGVSVEVRGLGLPGGRATATTDAHGMAEVTVRLPRGAAARMEGGACGYTTSTSFEVEVQTTPAIVANICTYVALEAQVLPRVRSVVVAPGASGEVVLVRVPGASGRPVSLEALYEGRTIASAWATGARGTLRIPNDVAGVIEVRARAVAPADARNDYDEEGATVVGTGARAAVLVRAADAFGLTLTASAASETTTIGERPVTRRNVYGRPHGSTSCSLVTIPSCTRSESQRSTGCPAEARSAASSSGFPRRESARRRNTSRLRATRRATVSNENVGSASCRCAGVRRVPPSVSAPSKPAISIAPSANSTRLPVRRRTLSRVSSS